MSQSTSNANKKTLLTKVWQQNKEVLSVYGFFLGLGTIGLIYFVKGDVLLLVQDYQSSFLDQLMIVTTELGDGWPYVICATIAAVFFSFRHTIIVGLMGGFVSLIVPILKWLYGFPRPAIFFDWIANDEFRELPQMPLAHSFNSFPSGHTTAAFALYFLVLFMTKRTWIKYIALFVALAVSISRMYLGKHFLEDVVLGSVLGIAIAFYAFKIFLHGPKLGEWSNQNLKGLFGFAAPPNSIDI